MPKTALGGFAAQLAKIRAGSALVADATQTPPATANPAGQPEESATADLKLVTPSGVPPEVDDEDFSDEFADLVRDQDDDEEPFDPDDLGDFEEDLSPRDVPGQPFLLPDLLEAEEPLPEIQLPSELVTEPDDEKLFNLFSAYFNICPSPTDEQLHALAASVGIPHEKLEETLFRLIGEQFADESVGAHNV